MEDSKVILLKEIIKLTRLSELKFHKGDFKVAAECKRKVNMILKSESNNEEIIDKFKEELSNLYSTKFDLIFDHKLKIDELKKKQIVKLLLDISNKKFDSGDFKGAVKALRRSEKYLSK